MEVPTVTIKRKKMRTLGTAIYSAVGVFYMGKYFFGKSHFTYGENPFPTIGVLALLGFMTLMLLFITYNSVRQLLEKGPALILNSDGIIDHVSPAKAGLLRWEDITHVDIQKLGWKKHMVIHLVNDDWILEKVKGGNRIAVNQAKEKTGSAIAVSTVYADFDLKRLTNRIQEILEGRAVKKEMEEPPN